MLTLYLGDFLDLPGCLRCGVRSESWLCAACQEREEPALLAPEPAWEAAACA